MRQRLLRSSFLLVILVAMSLAAPGAQQSDGTRAAVEANNKKFAAAGAKGDAAAIAALYTMDATAFPPNADAVRGRAAIEKLWKSVIDAGITIYELTATDVEAQGNLASESGTYVMKMKDGKVADRGKYVVVWKNVNGQWLLHRDIWNTSMPAAK